MNNFHGLSLADRVYDKLESDIIQGVYKHGEIVTELKLAQQLGVSRTPIREALRRLEQEHLIEDSGKGSVVLGISDENIIDIMQIRVHIEPMASYYAALNRTEEDIKLLTHIVDLQDFYASKQDLERLRQEDDDFHDAICTLCHRTVIADVLVPLHRKTRRYRKVSYADPVRQAQSLREHRAIYNAIAAGDAELASKLTAQHIQCARDNMIARLQKNG